MLKKLATMSAKFSAEKDLLETKLRRMRRLAFKAICKGLL